jgi:nicotinamidase-related amidase
MERSEIDAIPIGGDVSFRERAVEPATTALLVIDMQNRGFNEQLVRSDPENRYFYDRVAQTVIPNCQRLIDGCRAAGIEVMYTVIESLTLDGRDRGLDYKISGLFAAKGSWEAQVIDDLKPLDNEIVIPKTSSSLFNSTNFEYVLRNLGIEYLVVAGVVTDQCVETTVRDGCDRGFLMTVVEDACAAHSEQRHEESLAGIKGYCRRRTTEAMIDEIAGVVRSGHNG